MAEKIVNILEEIRKVKGQEYVEGMVDMANLLSAGRKDQEDKDPE